MAEEAKRYAPYLAWKTFFNLIAQLAQKGLPTRIDRSFLTGRSGADQTYLIATLKAFGMILDDGTVTAPLRELVAGDSEERQRLVAQLVRAHYPEVFALPANATQSQLDDTFRAAFGSQGDTLRKAETFLLHAATYAGVKLSPYFKTPRGVSGTTSAPRKGRKARSKPTPSNESAGAAPDQEQGASMRERYFEVLLKRIDSTDEIDTGLLDRIERLIGPGTVGAEQSEAPSLSDDAEKAEGDDQ